MSYLQIHHITALQFPNQWPGLAATYAWVNKACIPLHPVHFSVAHYHCMAFVSFLLH